MFVHEDDRRKLIEWSGGKVSKALIAKQDCVVGDHYHQHKRERFLLVSRRAAVIVGDAIDATVTAPFEIDVPPNTYHRFNLQRGSTQSGILPSAQFGAQNEEPRADHEPDRDDALPK